jgi:hypothetical protein
MIDVFVVFWIESLLAVHLDAVLQLHFAVVVALEVDLIRCMVCVADEPEVRELIRSLRRHLGCLARSGIQRGLGTAKSHAIQIAQAITGRFLAGGDDRPVCGQCDRDSDQPCLHGALLVA